MKSLGNNKSKDKGRPKSSSDPGKQKSMEYVQDITTCEDHDNVIVNECVRGEYHEYTIDPSLLRSEHVSSLHQQTTQVKNRIPVKVLKQKVISSSKTQKSKPKEKVLIARNARSNPTCQLATRDMEKIKPHCILGTLEEYRMGEAMKNGASGITNVVDNDELMVLYDKKEIRYPDLVKKGDTVHIDEKNALKNWSKQMNERQKQQHHLSKHMAVSNEMLLMNQGDQYRSIQEERTLIDRSMPSKDYGKGYRVGSEFWKQTETLESDERVNITLSKTEKGNVPSIEHVGYPSTIKKEMGNDWKMTHRMKYTHYPWWRSEYLHERQQHLQNVIEELNPHNVVIDELEVIGRSVAVDRSNDTGMEYDVDVFEDTDDEDLSPANDPLVEYDNVISQPVFGPSLLIDGHSARWQNDESSDSVCIRLLFTSDIGSSGKKSIEIKNDGTTVIHYLWKQLPGYNPFNICKGRPLKRFFFNVSSGIILPGDVIDIPFTFKSPNAGIFTETWRLETLPRLCGKGIVQITLHGIATECDRFEGDRKLLDKYLLEKQNKVMAERILLELLASIKTPERPSTPVDNYVTEDEIFNEKNEKLHFKMECINKLKAFHKEFNPDAEWDMSLEPLVLNIANMEEGEEKESAFQRINTDIKELNYSTLKLAPNSKYDACYLILCDTFDKFAAKAQKLGNTFGLPEKELVVKSSETTSKRSKKTDADMSNKSRTDTRTSKKDPSVKNKTPKEKGKRDTTMLKPTELESESIIDVADLPVSNSNYLEKLYMEVYDCLSEMAVNLEAVLD